MDFKNERWEFDSISPAREFADWLKKNTDASYVSHDSACSGGYEVTWVTPVARGREWPSTSS